MARKIERETIQQLLDNGAPLTLVEALPRAYFDQGHLPGAVQINHDEVEAKAPALLPDKDSKIVVYCANDACRNSAQVAETLVALGYTDVAEYEAGKKDWMEHGLPVESAAAPR